jgi:hypothetical protein
VSCSLRDAVTLETRGIPAVVLCTTPFMNAAAAHARLLGRPDLQAIEVQHPVVSLSRAELHGRAEAVYEAVVKCLLDG